jgi:hypothetical protein
MYDHILNPFDAIYDMSEIGLMAFSSPEFAASFAEALVRAAKAADEASEANPVASPVRIAA